MFNEDFSISEPFIKFFSLPVYLFESIHHDDQDDDDDDDGVHAHHAHGEVHYSVNWKVEFKIIYGVKYLKCKTLGKLVPAL